MQKMILKWVWLLILLSTGLVGHAQVITVQGIAVSYTHLTLPTT